MFNFFKNIFSKKKNTTTTTTNNTRNNNNVSKNNNTIVQKKELSEKEKMQQKLKFNKIADQRMENILNTIKKQNQAWFVHMLIQEHEKEKEVEQLIKKGKAKELKDNINRMK